MDEINSFLPFFSTDGIVKTFCTKNFRLILFKNEMQEIVRAKLPPTLEGKWLERRQHDVPKQNGKEHSGERDQVSTLLDLQERAH